MKRPMLDSRLPLLYQQGASQEQGSCGEYDRGARWLDIAQRLRKRAEGKTSGTFPNERLWKQALSGKMGDPIFPAG